MQYLTKRSASSSQVRAGFGIGDFSDVLCMTRDCTENMYALRVELWDSDTLSDDLLGS